MLLPDRDTDAVVRVVNTTPESFVLDGGIDIGRAHMAVVVDPKQSLVQDQMDSDHPSTNRGPPVGDPARINSLHTTADLEHLNPVLASLPDDMSSGEREEATRLIVDYQDVFSRHEFDLGRTD